MPANRLHTPYRERIRHYCEAHGIVVPSNFDATKSVESLVMIDTTDQPFTLLSRSTHQWREVVEYTRKPSNQSRTFRVLDFKRGCELVLKDDRLVRGPSFEHRLPNEHTHLVEP